MLIIINIKMVIKGRWRYEGNRHTRKSSLTFVFEALVIFFCSNFIVSWPAGRFAMFGMFIGGLMLWWRLFSEFRELNWDGEPPANVTASLTGGGVSVSGKVTSGSVRSVSSGPLPSLQNAIKRIYEYILIFREFDYTQN